MFVKSARYHEADPTVAFFEAAGALYKPNGSSNSTGDEGEIQRDEDGLSGDIDELEDE